MPTRFPLLPTALKAWCHHFSHSIQTLPHAKNILVLGNTGAGKSTSIAYWLGATLRQTAEGIEQEKSSIPYPEIGNDSFESKTSYPGLYSSPLLHNYLDCPGFQDTREDSEVYVNLTIQFAVRWLKTIDLAVIVIDYPSLLASRGAVIKKLLQVLVPIFNPLPSFKDNLLFVITKAPTTLSRESLLKTLTLLSNFLVKDPNCEKEVALLPLMQSQLHIINPLDSQSLAEFLTRVEQVEKPLDASVFNFTLPPKAQECSNQIRFFMQKNPEPQEEKSGKGEGCVPSIARNSQ